MTMRQQIRKTILELLSDGKEHSTQEINNYIFSIGIVLDKNSSLIRNVMHSLKKECPNLTNPSRGIYKLVNPNADYINQYSELKTSIATIEKTLQECKNVNWYICTDTELKIIRTKAQMLLNLANTITHTLK